MSEATEAQWTKPYCGLSHYKRGRIMATMDCNGGNTTGRISAGFQYIQIIAPDHYDLQKVLSGIIDNYNSRQCNTTEERNSLLREIFNQLPDAIREHSFLCVID